ncbi:leucyl aminopeptidase [Roseicyclus sp. F158]|uniref:Probable cytosol aminopeptidase n=1 Tax=Tropicimonas omnivorans TaxID=3075590 RepID=A0ABU3DE19_9RHOB|nr:leucyl aminopeptidase [Roseicyclus sp. F158]MDT0681968.1 leucyl aminopeptidase [Roseicyclus sp. F158]
MTDLPTLAMTEIDLDAIVSHGGRIALFVNEDGKLGRAGRRVSSAGRGAIARFVESEAFGKMAPGDAKTFGYPGGLAATSLTVVKAGRPVTPALARRIGAAAADGLSDGEDLLLIAGTTRHPGELALGALLRAYSFTECKSSDAPAPRTITVMAASTDGAEALADEARARAEGVYFTRDLVNLPANILTTESFAGRLEGLRGLGLEVEILGEAELEKLGMGMLLAVGRGSETPSRVAVMTWNGGAKGEAPLALVGKGVVFDTGGISLKPAGGMEEMTMDMGGAGTVAGAMKTIALRKARANVVGLVGLVENMPDGRAMRPGDIVTSMKGDTVEVINTDAEGRLVLGDVMWYAQERFAPAAMIDLATLTGAVIVALGHENAGVFSNDDDFAGAFLKAAGSEGEGAWRLPLGDRYAKLLKSAKADVKNVGTRWAGSVTAAEFLKRFVKDETPWMHLDIAGVASPAEPFPTGPKGASGWGVLSLDRLVRDRYETSE